MAWSAKLISGSGGVQGYNEWELFYNPSTQTAYKLTYNIGTGGDAPDVLYHTPDNGAPIPVRANGRNRLIFLEMHIPPQTSWDNVLDALAPISRLVGGAESQALRAVDGTAEAVKVAIKPDGATNTTYFDVLHGFIDTNRAFTQDVSMLNTTAYGITIALTCKPYGYGDAYTLNNSLPSSPHFVENNTSADLGDGWNLVGTPTNTIDTTTYLIGGKSQKLVVDNSTSEGIESDAVTAAQSTDAVSFFWVATNGAAADPLTVELEDGSNNSLDTTVISFNTDGTESSAVSDGHRIGSDGTNWYRVVVAGTNSAAANFVLRVYRASGDAAAISTYFIDGAYLQTGTLTAPDGWASAAALKNQYDPATAEANINYLDVWGVPGDIPGIINTSITAVSASARTSPILYGCRLNHLKNQPAAHLYLYDDIANLTGTIDDGSPAAWTVTADATTHGGSYIQTSTGAGVWTGTTVYFDIDIDDTESQDFHTRKKRLFAKMKVVGADTITVSSAVIIGANGSIDFKPVTIGTASKWLFIDLGSWNPNLNAYDLAPASIVNPTLRYFVESSGTATDVQVDAIWTFPVDEEFVIVEPGTNWNDPTASTAYDALVINGNTEEASLSAPLKTIQVMGSLWNIRPAVLNRFIYARADSADDMLIADSLSVVLTITPRTSHLLGTA